METGKRVRSLEMTHSSGLARKKWKMKNCKEYERE